VEGLLLPGAPPSRAYLLGSEGHFIVVGTYTDSPITVSHTERKQRLYAFVDPSSPPQLSRFACPGGGGAGYRPRVRSVYCTRVYRHSRQAGSA